MTLTKLLGVNEELTPSVSCVYGGYIRWQKFNAIASGVMNIFRMLNTFSNNHCYVGIWADNAGAIGTHLNHAEGIGLGVGWNDIVIPDTTIVSSTDYWLGFWGDGDASNCGPASGSIKYKNYGTVPTYEDNPSGVADYSPASIMVAGYNLQEDLISPFPTFFRP